MPEQAALIAALIIERPLCVWCIVSKSGMASVADVESKLAQVRRVLKVNRHYGRCRACGDNTVVMSMRRPT